MNFLFSVLLTFIQIKDGYTMKEIVFDWLPGNTPPVTIDRKLEMPDYILSNNLVFFFLIFPSLTISNLTL